MPTDRKLLVFISSTSDLSSERQAVARGLPHVFDPYLYEQDVSGADPPKTRLYRLLRRTDAFVGILGTEYGTQYDNGSIVEWEFKTAKALGVSCMLPFVKADAVQQTQDRRQREFLRRIKDFESGFWAQEFQDPTDLSSKVNDSLWGWAARFISGVAKRERDVRRVLPPTALLIVMLSVVAVVVFRHHDFAQTAILAICGWATGMVLACLALFMWMGGGRGR